MVLWFWNDNLVVIEKGKSLAKQARSLSPGILCFTNPTWGAEQLEST